MSRVTSPTLRTFRPRIPPRQSRAAPGGPQAGRPHPRGRGHEQRAEHRRQPADPRIPLFDRIGVSRGELRELVVVGFRVAVVLRDVTAVGERQEVWPDRGHLVAVLRELEVAEDRVGHQAHHVAERGDLELRRLGPRGHRVGGAARLVARLQHHGARPGLRQVGAGDQPVVPATDDDRVVALRRHGSDSHLTRGRVVVQHPTPEWPFRPGAIILNGQQESPQVSRP